MVRLFISFSGVLKALRSGRVTAEDLEQGLFVFGRPRDHVFSPGSSGEGFGWDKDGMDLEKDLFAWYTIIEKPMEAKKKVSE